MSDKTSQRTEEEMLDQTFAGFDQDMTEATTEDPQTAAPAANKVKGKDNTNKILIGGGAVAAVVAAGYLLLGGNSAPVQQQAAPVQQQPVVVTPPAPIKPAQPAVQPEPALDPATNFLSGQNNNVNPLAGNQPVQSAPVNLNEGSVGVSVNNSPTITTDAPVTITTTPNPTVATPNPVSTSVQVTPANTTGSNLVQQELVEQLKQMFEQQTKEIKASVDQVGSRVTELEKSVTSQKDINKSIEERLARLEAGKPTIVSNSDAKPRTVTQKSKKVYRKAIVAKSVQPKERNDDFDSSLLVDKSFERSERVERERVLPSYEDIQIHSVFAGRVWTKNKDGSLSTYSAGDRLSSGEIIRKIDDDKAQIITDRRTIK